MPMSVDELISDEVAYAKAHENDQLPDNVTVTRPNRGTVLSVRLSEQEYDMLKRRAGIDGLPVSTTGRRLIVAGLETDMKETVIQALRETLAPGLLASNTPA